MTRRRRKERLPKWQYDFNCRKCDNIQEIHDDNAAQRWNMKIYTQEEFNALPVNRYRVERSQ